MPATDCWKSKPNKAVIFKGTSSHVEEEARASGLCWVPGGLLITSTALPAVSALFQWAFPCVQIPECCNGVALSQTSDQE